MISRRVGRNIIEMSNDDREPLYDFMKGILIIMVLLNHVINQYGFNVLNENNDYIRPLIFMVNMPSFFIVAGYFCPTSLSKYGVKQYCTEKVKRLLWPLVVWGFLRWCSTFLLEGGQLSIRSLVNNIFCIWFLPIMFIVSILMGILLSIYFNKALSLIYIFYFIGVVIFILVFRRYFSINNILFYGFYYVLGIWWKISGNTHAFRNTKRNEIIFALIGNLMLFIYIYLIYWGELISNIRFFFGMCATFYFIFLMKSIYQRVAHKKMTSRICDIGRFSLEIYVLQIIVVELWGFRIYHILCQNFFSGINIFAPNIYFFYLFSMWLWTISFVVICYQFVNTISRSRYGKHLWKL